MPTILAYPDRISARPGEELAFHVSVVGGGDYSAELVRLISGDLNPAGPGFKSVPIASALSGTYAGEDQPIAIGSYAIVPPQPTLDLAQDFTVSLICRAGKVDRGIQGLIGRWSESASAGWALVLDEKNRPALLLGDGSGTVQRLTLEAPVGRNWFRLTAIVSRSGGEVMLRRTPLKGRDKADLVVKRGEGARASLDVSPAELSDLPLLMAALSTGTDAPTGLPAVTCCFTGRLEKPRLVARALPDGQEGLLELQSPPDLIAADTVGWWNLEDGMTGDAIVDSSRPRHHGYTVNNPARAVCGVSWDGSVHDWKSNPSHYAAIHFHADDMTDARWNPSIVFQLPEDLKSGIYAAKLTAGDYVDYVPFAVRPAPGAKKSKLVFLMPTASYLAYSNWVNDAFAPGAEQVLGHTVILGPHDLILANHPGMGLSMYERHIDGTGVMYAGRRRPILNMRPDYICPHGTFGSPVWQFGADLHITDWLEAKNIDYDVLTDEDLHLEGAACLSGYKAVMTGTHPEYHSDEQLDALQHFIENGGRLFYTGGNGFYWRVAYHPDDSGIIELRRAEGGWRSWACPTGEYYDSFTGGYGGLWLNIGKQSARLTGLTFSAAGMNVCTHYVRLPDSFNPRASFIFDGVGENEKIGNFGLKGGGAVGIELDRFDPDSDAPGHTLVLATSEDIPNTYTGAPEMFVGTVRNTSADMTAKVAADLVFFETNGGGAVFSTGSIAWAGSLFENGYENNVSRITENVLRRFMDDEPFGIPSDAA